ncbi:hypothetical protein PTTG_27800 [Puccinia triticina 1-1 BBBD Race 1]|uniref:Uncharacterized protein n=1 Tax=Puccinia triticina (isolate 1-1 / race 1 (BBBD)) TaxID=630390 RepID=A0A180GHC3_PUCT1|nr:hypothetical protein PTTG_27800 [Puccinia triticina 1-1 BBBD Race 1]
MQESDAPHEALDFATRLLPDSRPIAHDTDLRRSQGPDFDHNQLHFVSGPWPGWHSQRPESDSRPVPQHFDTRPRSETDSHQNLLDSPRPELDPISHEIASRTPPELACLQDNIYFDDSPWPEIETHPIPDGINPHSPSVQQEQPYSPNELQNSGRKRKEPSRDDAEIPFEIVNCGRPAKSERQIICEAIRSIKQINGCRLISDEREDEYKILTIKEDQIYRFLSQVVQKKRNKYNLHRFGLANLLDVTQEQYSQVQQKRRQCALLRFKSEANTRKLKLFYT